MKVSPLLFGFATVALLSTSVLGWSNEDHEIFDIVSALETAEGKGTNFYSFLNVTKAANESVISKAYRKRSLELHPDKNPNDSVVAERFARLGTVVAILRDAGKRERYDHFYENGVPRWRGTGYYYSRYRPGLGMVLGMLAAFSCFIQYFFLYMKYYLGIQQIKAFQHQALEMAWGPTKKPLAGRKRMKVQTGESNGLGIPGINRGRPTKSGATLEIIVEGEKVYMVERGEELLLDVSCSVKPNLKETWIPHLLMNLYLRLTGQPPLPTTTFDDEGYEEEVVEEKVVGKNGKTEIVLVRKPKGPARGVEIQGKIGGMRRKVMPKRPETPKPEEVKKAKKGKAVKEDAKDE